MSAILPKEKIEECKEVFFHFSKGEPVLVPNQLKEALIALGGEPTQEELEKIWKEIDLDGNGTINIDEFLEIFSKQMKDPEIEEDLYEAFRNFDILNTGYISIEELKRVMTCYGTQMSNIDFDNFVQIYLRNVANETEKNKREGIDKENNEEERSEYKNEHYVNIKKFVKILLD